MRPVLHPYSLESRQTYHNYLVILGVAFAWAWAGFTGALRTKGWEFPYYIDTPAALGFYAFFVYALDRWLWFRWPFQQLLDAPDFRGDWDVVIRTSHDNHAESIVASAEIRQTWSKLSITLTTGKSESASTGAHVLAIAPGGGFEIVYEYENQPRAAEVQALSRHSGTAWLRLDASGALAGEYYTSGERRTYGELTFRRKPR